MSWPWASPPWSSNTTGQPTPAGIAVDSSKIYFTNEIGAGAVMVLPIIGGTPVAFVSSQGYAESIVVEGTNVYWADYAASGSVMQAAK
jgi:hypothetical protein